MNALRSIAREIFGLFVDDGALAVAIVLWVVLLRLILSRLGSSPQAGAIVFAAGLGLILAESTLRYARRRRR